MRLKIALIFLISTLMFVSFTGEAPAGGHKILLLYSAGQVPAGVRTPAGALRAPIYHFRADIKELPVSEYKKGLINDFDAVFYFGTGENSSPGFEEFTRDAAAGYKDRTICWVYEGIERLLAVSGLGSDIAVAKDSHVYKRLSYGGMTLESENREANKITIAGAVKEKVQVLGELENAGESAPFAVNTGKLWYFSTLPLNEDDYLAFCDILHPALDMPCYAEGKGPRAIFEVDHVGPGTDPAKLRDVCCVLSRNKARAIVDIVPIDYAAGKKISDNQFLARMLNTMLSLDAAAVLKIGDPENAGALDEQMDELVENDIYPLAVKSSGSVSLNSDFSTSIQDGAVPFLTRDEGFQRIVFINYKIPAGAGREAFDAVRRAAKKHLILRDAVLSVGISPDIDPKMLKVLIKDLRALGYGFMDLRLMPNYARSANALIFSQPGFYARMPYQQEAYGGRKKIDLVKFEFEDKYAVESVLDRHLRTISEKSSQFPLNGTGLVDIPFKHDYFVLRQTGEPPSPLKKYKKKVLGHVLGWTSSSPLDSFNRIAVIVIFLMTLFLLFYMVNILLIQLRSGRYKGL